MCLIITWKTDIMVCVFFTYCIIVVYYNMDIIFHIFSMIAEFVVMTKYLS